MAFTRRPPPADVLGRALWRAATFYSPGAGALRFSGASSGGRREQLERGVGEHRLRCSCLLIALGGTGTMFVKASTGGVLGDLENLLFRIVG